MSALQILTVVATCLGIVATVLNLVAFVREKDRSHLKVGCGILAFLVLAMGLALAPILAPGPTGALLRRLPPGVAERLSGWLTPAAGAPAAAPTAAPTAVAAAPEPPPPEPPPPALQGSCTVEIRRNLLGGIDKLVAVFQFADLSGHGGRVTAYRFGVQEEEGGPLRSFERVLPQPVEVAAGGAGRAEVDLDPEIGDRWLARRDKEHPGRLEVEWTGVDAEGQPTRFSWSEGPGS